MCSGGKLGSIRFFNETILSTELRVVKPATARPPISMFLPLSRFFQRAPAPDEADLAFVKDVRIEQPRIARNQRSEWVLVVGWALVLAKCVLVWWACRAYSVPVHPAWVIVPTLMGAALCTVLYWRRY